MAEKGARKELESVARQMFVDGKDLVEIEAILGVSRQSLSDWKKRTKRPGEEKDEWDKARGLKTSFGVRLGNLFDREMQYAEEREPGSIPQPSLNALQNLGAMVIKFKTIEANAGDSAPVDESAAMEMLQGAMEKAKAMQTDTDKGLVLEELVANLALQQTLQGLSTGSIQVALIPKILGEIGKLQASSIMREKHKAEIRAKVKDETLAAAAAAAVKTLKKNRGASDKLIEEIRADILGVELPA